MQVTVHPTEEMHTQNVDGRPIELRVWEGTTDQGTPVTLFVLSIMPTKRSDYREFESQVPGFMIPTRVRYKL